MWKMGLGDATYHCIKYISGWVFINYMYILAMKSERRQSYILYVVLMILVRRTPFLNLFLSIIRGVQQYLTRIENGCGVW